MNFMITENLFYFMLCSYLDSPAYLVPMPSEGQLALGHRHLPEVLATWSVFLKSRVQESLKILSCILSDLSVCPCGRDLQINHVIYLFCIWKQGMSNVRSSGSISLTV